VSEIEALPRINQSQAAQLRKPFDDEQIGKLPRITCVECRDKKVRCTSHEKRNCKVCGNWISTAHIHLDYAGHAVVTDRLLQVDPEWSWEPLALDKDGLPFIDSVGGMWIRLTVLGVPRLGYGDAGGKRGADAVKETIGDAIRNSALRFGVGLDLWGAKFETRNEDDGRVIGAPPETITAEQEAEIFQLWHDLGFDGDANYEGRMTIARNLLRIADLESTSDLLHAEAHTLIMALRKRLAETTRKAKVSQP
jgi:hypothetical protein